MIDDDKLTPEQFSICRLKSTEPPFTGQYVHCKTDGIYHCICCDAPLFDSQTKYDSGSGWASFWQAIENRVTEHSDDTHGMQRVEIVCANCKAHLGHVFTDGIEPTGLRYCLNSGALLLKERR
jgi:peptide-methionine (R)-S-oxide reductase